MTPLRDPVGLGAWLDALRAGVDDARGPVTVDGVHDLRVATRRVDVYLRLGGWAVLREDLRRLRTVAGPVRDLDVRMAEERRASGRPARGRVATRRRARDELRAEAAHPDTDALLLALSLLPPLPRDQLLRGRRRLARRLLEQEVDPAQAEDVHRRRRALRRLRYACELLGEPVDELVVLQDALGAVSDAWIAARLTGVAPDPEALSPLLADAEAAWRTHLPAIEARSG